MKKKLLLGTLVCVFVASAAPMALGQSAYFQAVTNMNPIGYWPLNETTPPPQAFATPMIATNSGTLGAQGNGYYGAWYQPSGNTWYLTNNILQSNLTTYPLLGETALNCTFSTGSGQYVVVPRAPGGIFDSNLTITPPMSVEVWVVLHTTSSGVYGFVSEGAANLDYGGPNPANPYWGGPSDPGWAGFFLGQYTTYTAFNYYMTNGTSKANELDSPHTLAVNSWYHVVCTYDGTNEILYVNGAQANSVTHSKNAAGVSWAPDLTTPLMIGSGNDVSAQGGGGDIEANGLVAEAAIYNYILQATNVLNHYMAGYGTNANGDTVSYPSVIEGDSPTLFYRMNEPQTQTNAGYASSTFPVATNYGTLGASANGAYQPGTAPGAAGPPFAGFDSNTAVALNGFFGAVDVGGGSLPAALNPVGTVPFTVTAWFQGNSADAPARYQDIVGHGSSSYRLFLGENCGENRFDPGAASSSVELGFANPADMITNKAAKNDGQWHMEAGVTDGTNAYMYLDGVLVKSTNTGTGINIVGSPIDLLLGGDPSFTAASYNAGATIRTFDGQIAQVAIWSTNLDAAQIQALYNAAGVPPSFVTEPLGATNDQDTALTVTAVIGGSQPITYQWYGNGTAVPGQTNLTLSFPSVTTNQDGSYYLVATSPYGTATSSVVQVFVYGPPSILTDSLSNYEIFSGGNPYFYVSASGAQPLFYQWYSNNVLIASATNSSFVASNAQTGASYSVVISNAVGTLSAGPFALTVVPRPTAPYPRAVLADDPIAYWRLDETNGDTAYDHVSGYNGTYTNVALAYFGPVGVSQGYSPLTDSNEVAPGFGNLVSFPDNSFVGWVPTNLNFVTPTNVNAEFSVECWILGYLPPNQNTNGSIVAQELYGNGGEEFVVDIVDSSSAAPLRFFARDAGGTAESAETAFTSPTDFTWHHVVAVCDEANSNVLLYIDGTNAAKGSIPARSGILNAAGSLTIGSRQEGLGTQYDDQWSGGISQVALYDYALSPAQVMNHYLADGIGPSLTVEPSSETTNVGETASFTAVSTGTAPLYYQWYDQNNHLISTNAVLTIPNVQLANQGNYTVTVSNAYGTASGVAFLSVVAGPPQITQDLTPLSQTVPLYAGEDMITYSVGVSGTVPITYQWFQNGTVVLTTTNSTHTFTALPGTNTYYVTASNAFTQSEAGGVPARSSTATVIGVPVPQLTPANYAYRMRISFPGYTGNPLTNFPALITLDPATISGFSYSQFAGSNGADLVFADASGTAILPSEIDEWDDGGVSTIWVQIPVLNGTNIWAYWGDPSFSQPAIGSSNVWLNAGYEIVYHLKETNFPFADSTGQYPATNGVAPSPTAGVVGHGEAFNGSDYISPGPVTLSNMFTTYAWVNLVANANNIQTIWANQLGGYGANGFAEFVDFYNTPDRGILLASGNGVNGQQPEFSSLPSAQWHLLTFTLDQTVPRYNCYLDDTLVSSGTALVNDFGLTNVIQLGAFLGPAFPWTGSMDEARVQSGVASTNWIDTTYLNMENAAFVSYSSVNLGPPLSISRSINGYTFSWPTNDGSFVLESTTNLTPPAVWTPITTPSPAIIDGVWQQTIPATNAGSYFFRLQAQ